MATTLYADDYSGTGTANPWRSYISWTVNPNANNDNLGQLWPGSSSVDDTAVFWCSAGTPTVSGVSYNLNADVQIAALEMRSGTELEVRASTGDGRKLTISSGVSVTGSGRTLIFGYAASSYGYYKVVPVTPSFVIPSGSTVRIVNSLGNGSTAVTVSGGGTLDIQSYFLTDPQNRYPHAAGIQGLTVTGSGTTVQARVANSLGSGSININSGGVVEVREASALLSATSGSINGGSLHCYVTNPVVNFAFSVQGTDPVLAKAANVTTPPISLAGTTTIQVDSSWVNGGNLGGVAGNGNRLVLSGSGTQTIINLVEALSFGSGGLTLSGAAPWAYLAAGVSLTGTGATILNGGKLDVDGTASISTTSAIQINGAATELVYRTTAVVRDIDNIISGSGKILAGRCKFSDLSDFSGAISQTYTEFVDSCQIDARDYAGAVTSGSGGVVWNSDADQIFAGVIGGTGGFTKRNSSKVTFSALNTYGGTTTVNAGELVIEAGGRSGSGPLIVNAGGVLTIKSGGVIGTGGATTLSGSIQTAGAQVYPGALVLGLGSTLTIGGA
jgi:autotransporter-associated beta strand protein